MYVRRKKNSSGSISVQVIDKSSGKYKVVHSVGSSGDMLVVSAMEQKANSWIKESSGQLELDFAIYQSPTE